MHTIELPPQAAAPVKRKQNLDKPLMGSEQVNPRAIDGVKTRRAEALC